MNTVKFRYETSLIHALVTQRSFGVFRQHLHILISAAYIISNFTQTVVSVVFSEILMQQTVTIHTAGLVWPVKHELVIPNVSHIGSNQVWDLCLWCWLTTKNVSTKYHFHSPGATTALGLELRDRVFLGVPGGVRGGVTPLPFTRLSPAKDNILIW